MVHRVSQQRHVHSAGTHDRFRYTARLDETDYPEPTKSSRSTHGAIPARMRGELFDQKSVTTYSLYDNYLIGNLRTIHEERVIVIQFDVSQHNDVDGHHWLPACRRRVELAEQVLEQLRKRLVGPIASLFRCLLGHRMAVFIEGPFMPHQPDIALMMLTIRVSRESNYDDVYNKVKRFLELHRSNDYREEYLPFWQPQAPKPVVSDKPCAGYPWTKAEFDAIERMARLESVGDNAESDWKYMAFRRQYNERILEEVQSELESELTEETEDASSAANQILRDFFMAS